MDGHNHHQLPRVVSPSHRIEARGRRGLGHNSEQNAGQENVLPGWIKPDLSLEDSVDDSLVGKTLTLSPRANSSMSFEADVAKDDAPDKAKRRVWPFGKKKKSKDKEMHRNHHRHSKYDQRDAREHFRYGGETAMARGEGYFDHMREDPQPLYDADRWETGEDLQQHYFRGDPELYQKQMEENNVQLHMAADYAARELIQREQQRRQDMFRQEMEDRARQEEEALRQQEAAVLRAINSGNQDNLMAVLSSTTGVAGDHHTSNHPSQQKLPTFLENFLQGTMELCSSESVKYVEGKAKKIAEVLRDAFEDERNHGSQEADSHPKYVVDETGVYVPTHNHLKYAYA